MFDAIPGPVRWMGEDAQQAYWRAHDIWWNEGVRFADGLIPEPLQFSLQPVKGTWDHGPHMPLYLKGARMPIFRDDLVEAFREAGVDSLDVYRVVLTDPESNEQHENYKAVNIIGLVSAADMQKSQATVHDGMPLIDVSFDHLEIDEAKAAGIPIFRLAENTSTILVSEEMKDFPQAKGFRNLLFHGLDEVSLL